MHRMTAEVMSGWQRVTGGHWVQVDGVPVCDPTAEPLPTDGLSPWNAPGMPCPECAVVVTRFRELADRCGFDLRPRHRYPTASQGGGRSSRSR